MATATHESSNRMALVTFLLIAFAVAFIFGAVYYAQFYGNPLSPSSSPEEVVTEFGTRLKNVSLLAPREDVARTMDEHYAPYVSPGTLAAWKADFTNAPGRLTSSPWPDRIEVATGTPVGMNEYRVEGVVVEMTSDTALYGGQTTGYPVVVTLKRDRTWQITSFTRASDELPEGVINPMDALTGIYVCLPHKDQSGPQTFECAFGIQADDGRYYALDFSAFTSEQGMTVATGERIRAQGTLIPSLALPSDDPIRTYNIQGVLRVSVLTRL